MERNGVVVSGATGAQGGAVARAFLHAGFPVSAIVRDLNDEKALKLERLGAQLLRGDLNDQASLVAATRNANVVFSVQLYNPTEPALEQRQALNLVTAARESGVACFIQSSVSGAGGHAAMLASNEGRWDRNYWENKFQVEETARTAGFKRLLILRPAFMMENFSPPRSARMFPGLTRGVLATAISPSSKIALVAAADIGAAAMLALYDPAPVAIVELAGDTLTTGEIAAVLSDAWGVSIRSEWVSPEDALTSGHSEGWVRSQEWLTEVGYPARPDIARALGLKPTALGEWAKEHRLK